MTREPDTQEVNTAPPRRRRERTEGNQKRLKLYLTSLLAVLTLLVLLCGLFAPDRDFSDTENRKLAQFPALSGASLGDGSWFAGVSSWFADQFPFRDGWIALRSGFLRATGQKESGQVLFGKDCLLSVPETPDDAALAKTAETMNAFAAAFPDVQMHALLVPGAAAICADRLPKDAPVRDQIADVQVFSATLHGIRCIDAADALQPHAEEYIYYRTDHHWTSLGARYAFDAAKDALGITAPEYTFMPAATDFQGTLASRSGCGSYRDTVEICAPQLEGFCYSVICGENGEASCSMFSGDALSQKDKYTVFFGGNYDRVQIETTAESGKTLLLFKDSYANCFVQFLLPCYDKIVMIDPRYFYGDISPLMNGTTDVLFLYSADTLVKDTSLADVLGTALP